MTRNIRFAQFGLGFIVVLATGLTLAGCTSSTTGDSGGSSGSTPEFTGPWAAEFADSYAKADTDFAKEVLSDGKVTEQEFSEMLSNFQECVAAKGITVSDYGFDGSYKTKFDPKLGNDAANASVKECSHSSGEDLVGALYTWTHRNPDKLDENEITAACLSKKGVVPDGYGAKDYTTDSADDKFPFPDQAAGRAALDSCRMDPLGIQG
ncbi:hypothetical protein [Agreia sp. VKM Ac-1783]|uniref:hypothetical protein n=1 Tax=Agreia sp. VKM Ac-1783 TaxID=1938889 RepID=UPI000A2ADB29|nr:hypothetical protein [Agreia sp. VKM Ac-1783]SMQ71905.1 hypothetical protein SAMN06295943_2790 [Agreia sp. VKM Ac-1783]